MTVSRVCIVGPGAIGGMMAVKLSNARFDVSALVRSQRVDRFNQYGLTLLDGGETLHGMPKASDNAEDLGPQDLIVITVKEFALKEVAPVLSPMLAPDTQVVQITNGIPWWFFSSFGGDLQGTQLKSVDRDGGVSEHFELSRHIGGVINCGVSLREDGVLVHDHSNQLFLGRPDNDPRGVEAIADVFRQAGYNTDVAGSIHQQVMTKLLANVSFNPVSALAMGTLDLLWANEYVAETLLGLMNEGRAVTTALGLDPGPDPESRFNSGKKIPASKTSMLQDMEQGKRLELGGILKSTIEVADLLDVAVPLTKSMYGLLCVKEATVLGQAAE